MTPVHFSFVHRRKLARLPEGARVAPLKKKPHRTPGWLIAGAAALVLAAAILLSRHGVRSPLPATADYGNLPAQFNQALRSARENASATGYDSEAVRKVAQLYQANRLYREARICYQVIAAKPPGLTARDHYYLADMALNESDLPAAQMELHAVLLAEPQYVPARLALADSLFKSGDEAGATKEYAAIVALEPNHPQASLGLARIELQQGNEEAAVARLDELMASHPESISAAALFAQILDRRGESDRAVAMAQWSRQKPEPIPPDPWLAALMADCYDLQHLALTFEDYFKTGQIDEAVPFLRRVEELDPQSPVPPLLRGWSQAQGHHYAEAVTEYRLALAKGGDVEKICPYLTEALLALGRLPEAAELLAGYYARMPDSIPILTAYADVAVRQDQAKLARELLTKLLAREPYLYAPNVSLAKLLWTAGERDEAAKCLQRIATVYAKDVPSRALLGEYYLLKSDPVSAIRPLEQAIAQVPRQAPLFGKLSTMLDVAYLTAGRAAVDQGRFMEATDLYEKAAQLAPVDLKAWAGAANAAVQLKQFRRAAGALEKMAALQPENPTIYLSLGDVLYQNGDHDQAARQWQRALQFAAAADTGLRQAIADRLAGRITEETFK
jgi:tetratricopeptide (TPR) repeat protein